MKKLLILAVLAFCPHAAAVTCAGVSMPAGITSCFYVDSVSGLDTNAGTSAGVPWQHMPGMAICTNTCGSHTVSPGDAYLLMGNRTWGNATLGILLATNGTSGNPIYYGNPTGSTFFTPITGTANTDATGKIVTWVSGVHSLGDFSSTWITQTITVNGNSCLVNSVAAATWNLNGTMNAKPTLTCNASVGSNLTGTSFSASIWGPPITDAGGTVMGSNAGVANVMWRPYGNHFIIQNIEMKGLFWTGAPGPAQAAYLEFAGGTPGQGTNDDISGIIIHGWSHGVRTSPTCTTETNLILADSSVPNNNVSSSVHDSIVTGVDVDNSPGTSGAAFFGGPASIYRNYMEWVSDGGIINGVTTLHDNSIFNIGPTFQIGNSCGGVAHTNGLEFNAQSTDYTVYNNVIAHLGNGTLGLWTATNSGINAYIFNNVIFDTDTGNILDPAQSVANNGCPAGVTYCNVAGNNFYYNNTVECGPDSGTPSADCQGSNSALNLITHQNGYYVTTGAISDAPPTATQNTNLKQSKVTANGNGQTAAQTFAFSPTTGSLGSGTSNSSICTTINSLDATAGAACLLDTTYGVAIDRSNYTVTGSGRAALSRTSPQIGAYQFSALTPASSPTCSLTAGTYQGVQYPPCTNPNVGTTIQCYTLDGSTPTTNGSGTACTHGTALPSGNYVPITVTETLKLVAGTSINTDSSVASYSYVITPPTSLEITAISAPVVSGQTNFSSFAVVQNLNSQFLSSQTPALSGGTTLGTNPLAIDQETGTVACSITSNWTPIDAVVANYRLTNWGVQPASEGNSSTATSACVFSQAQANASALTWTASTAYLPSEYILASGNYWQIQVGCWPGGASYDNTCTSGLTLPNFTGAGPVTDGTVVWVKIGVNAPLQDTYCGAGHTCGGCNVSNPGVILNLNSVGTYTCPATSTLLTSTQLYNGQPIPYELPNRNWYNQIITAALAHFNGNAKVPHMRFGSPMGFENGGLGLIIWPYTSFGTGGAPQLRAQYISWINKFYAFIMSNQPTVKILANINSGAVAGSADPLYADQEAILANKYGMWGIGNEDYTIIDMSNLQGTGPSNCVFPLVPSNCTQGDWAYNFATFPNLAHELQTLTGSTPLDCTLAAGLTGPLYPLPVGFTNCTAGTVGLLPFLVTARSIGVGSPLQKIWVNVYESNTVGASGSGSPTQPASDVLLSLSPTYTSTANAVAAYAPSSSLNLQAFATFLGLTLAPGPNAPYFLGAVINFTPEGTR